MRNTSLISRLVFIALATTFAACGPTQQPIKRRAIDHKPPPDDPRRFPSGGGGGMEIDGDTGTMDEADVRNVMAANMAGFNNCFAKTAGSFVSGEVTLKFVVDGKGRVEQVSVDDSTLGSWPIEGCLVQTSRFLEFPPPMGAGRARFAYPMSWNDAGRRLSVPVDVTWGYEALRRHDDAIQECRKTHKYPDPFYLTVYVGRRGQVLSAGFHSKTVAPDTFPDCVVQSLDEMRFPDPGPRVAKYSALVENLPDQRR